MTRPPQKKKIPFNLHEPQFHLLKTRTLPILQYCKEDIRRYKFTYIHTHIHTVLHTVCLVHNKYWIHVIPQLFLFPHFGIVMFWYHCVFTTSYNTQNWNLFQQRPTGKYENSLMFSHMLNSRLFLNAWPWRNSRVYICGCLSPRFVTKKYLETGSRPAAQLVRSSSRHQGYGFNPWYKNQPVE